MPRGLIAAISLVVMLGAASCRKRGYPEIVLAAHTMQDLKSFRMASSSTGNSITATYEYVCPDRVHEVQKRDGNDEGSIVEEAIVIGKKAFSRKSSDGSWVQEADLRQPAGVFTSCEIGVKEATGGNFGLIASVVNGTPKEPKYMGQETVGGATCDSWGIPLETYAVHHPGQYEDPTPHWAAIVCIDPSSHRVLQTKRDDIILRFYDFNQNITIQEPETASPEQQGTTGSSGSQ